jgi:hypothetical protein
MYTKGMKLLTIFLSLCLFLSNLSTDYALAQESSHQELSFNAISKTTDTGKSILIIPMNGQMSTDISIDAYRPHFNAIRDLNPDLIIFEMFCQDFRDEFYAKQRRGDRKEQNGYDPDSVKDLAKLFRIELKDIDQIMWVQDSCGGSSVLALAWPDICMSQNAKLQGTHNLARNWNYIDRDKPTWGKMYQAWTAHVKNVAELGGRSIDFIMTFVDPDATASGTYDGRDVNWSKGLDGYLVFDGGPTVPNINAWDAEQFAISRATVRNLNDILVSEGIREYHIVGDELTESVEQYKIEWRKALAKAIQLWEDAQLYSTWAVGEDTERYLRKQLKAFEQVLRLLKRYNAVEFRMMREHGISQDGKYGTRDLRRLIKQIEERLRQLRDSDRRTPSGRGGGGLGGGGGVGR